MALTDYVSPCEGGTKQTRTPGGCSESSRIKAVALFKPGFDIKAFYDNSTPPAQAEDKANWDALIVSEDLCYLIKEAGGDLPDPAENTVSDLRRNQRLVDFTHAIVAQTYKYEGNENFVNYVNDNTFGVLIITEDKKAHIYTDKTSKFVPSTVIAKPVPVDGELRVQLTMNVTARTMPQVQDIPADLLD